MSDEEFNNIFKQWTENTLKKIKVLKVGKDIIYNANQTGLLYNQFTSRTFVKIENSKKAHGCNQIKSKERIFVMVSTSEYGSKVPLLIIGK